MEKSDSFECEEFDVTLDPREQRRRLSMAIKKVIYRDLPDETVQMDFRRHSLHCGESPNYEFVNPICFSQNTEQVKSNPTKKIYQT